MSLELPSREQKIANILTRLRELKTLMQQATSPDVQALSAAAPYVIDVALLIDIFRRRSVNVITRFIAFIEQNQADPNILTDEKLDKILAPLTNTITSSSPDLLGSGVDFQHNADEITFALNAVFNLFDQNKAAADLGVTNVNAWNDLFAMAEISINEVLSDEALLEQTMARFREHYTALGYPDPSSENEIADFIYNYINGVKEMVYANTKPGVDDVYSNIIGAFTNIFAYIVMVTPPPKKES